MRRTLKNTGITAATAFVGFAGIAAAQGVGISELDRASNIPSQFDEALADSPFKFSPVGDTEITIYGFARAEAFYDFDFQQGDLTRAGRVGDPDFATDGAFDTSVRVSRFGIRSSTPSGIGNIGTQLEFDLFGSGGDDSTSPNLRLRHANVTIGDNWLIGQFWTNFMPLVHYPRTADFNGPVGIAFARVPQIRYSNSVGNLQWSVSIEESTSSSDDPTLTAAAFFQGNNWSARIAGLVGTTDEDPAVTNGDTEDTNAVVLSAGFQPWEGGSLNGTYQTGDGANSILVGNVATDFDAGAGDTVESDSFTLEFRQQISDSLNVGIAYGEIDYDDAAFNDVESIHVNAFYSPIERLTIGLEYITIENGADDADRIGASVTFTF